MKRDTSTLESYVSLIDKQLKLAASKHLNLGDAGAYFTVRGNIAIDVTTMIDGRTHEIHSSILNLHTHGQSRQIFKIDTPATAIDITLQSPTNCFIAANLICSVVQANSALLDKYLTEHKTLFSL